MNVANFLRGSSIALIALFHTSIFAQEAVDARLFEYAEGKTLTHQRASKLSPAMFAIEVNTRPAGLRVGQLAKLPLPNGSVLDVLITTRKRATNGDIQIVGEFDKDGIAIITYGPNSTFANFNSSEHSYAIGIDTNKQAFLVNYRDANFEVERGDDMRYPPGFQPLDKLNAPPQSTQKSAKSRLPNGNYEVTLLAIFSAQFADGFDDPITRINQMIAFSNAAYQRSGINIELRLAHAQQN